MNNITENNSAAIRNISRKDTFKYKLLLEGIIVGAIAGVIIAGFRLLLVKADSLRNSFVDWVRASMGTGELPLRLVVAAAILIVLAVLMSLLLAWEPESSGSGIPQVEGELKGKLDMNGLRVIAAKISGCVLAIGGGLALGREGPSVQLGAMTGKAYARARHRLLTEERLLITCGAGAGLSAAFGAPLAGALFALEELHKTFSALVLVTTMASAAVSDWVASMIVGRNPVFDIPVENILPFEHYWMLLLLGLILGLLGAIYNRTLDTMQDLFARIASAAPARLANFTKIIAMFSVTMIMLVLYPCVLGSGGNLVSELCRDNYALLALLILFLIKFVYSTASFGSGAAGGIFLPLLVLGAICGATFSNLMSACTSIGNEYIASFVIVAMAGLFASIVRAPATGIVLITEMTGSFSCLLALVTVSLISYVTADALGAEPVYEQLWNRRVGKTKLEIDEEEGNRKVVIDADIMMASPAEGNKVQFLQLPAGCLIVAINRDGLEIIPSGSTKLIAGDHLEILCKQKDIAEVETIISNKCRYQKKDEIE